MFKKILSTLTAVAVTIFVSSGSLQTVVNEIRANAAEIVYGDADNSGSVDSFDLALIRKEAVATGSTKCNMAAADVNGDGIIDNSDVREVQQYLLGKRNSFSVIERNLVPVPKTTIVSKNQPIETSMTQEMADKADELKDAVSIYNFVYNNIRSEFYNGSRKGAIGTFEQGSGNDIDISSLLIAMLRYRGYNAKYVESYAVFNEEQLLKWTRTENIEAAEKIYASQNRIHEKYDENGLKLYICDYYYVQVINNGKTYYLDACFKEYEKQKTVYDQLDSSYKFTDAESIIKNNDISLFETDMNAAAESAGKIADINSSLYTHKIVPETFSSLSEDDPYLYDYAYDEIPNDKKEWVTIGFNNSCKVPYTSAELYRKNVIVTYEVSEDSRELAEGIIADTSSIFTLPSLSLGQSFSVTPVVLVDGERVLEGPNLRIGQKQNLFIVNESNGNRIEGTEELTAGEMCSIIFDTGMISSNELAEAYNTSLNNTAKINQRNNLTLDMKSNEGIDESNVYTSDYLGSILRFMGVMYFAQMDRNTQYLSERENINAENTLKFCIVGFTPEVFTDGTADARVKDGIQKQGRFFFDVLSNTVQPISKDSDDVSLRAFNYARGFISSELESAVIEEILNVNSVSTVSIFKYAQENNIPIVKISSNSETRISDLNISNEDAKRLQAEVDKGNSIIIPKSTVKIDNWSGIGYILVSNGGNTQEFMLSGGLHGGSTGIPIALYSLVNVGIDMIWFAGAVSALLAPASWLGLVVTAVFIALLYVDILKTIERNFDYYIYGDEQAAAAIKHDTFWNVVTFGVVKGGGAAISKIAGVRNAAKYGSTTINGLRDAGYTTKQINNQIKLFRHLGMTQPTIDTMLKNPRCMELGSDVLQVIGKTGGNQRLLADLVLKNGDDFARAVSNTEILDEVLDFAWKCGDPAAKIFVYDESLVPKANKLISEYGDDFSKELVEYFTKNSEKGAEILIRRATNVKFTPLSEYADDAFKNSIRTTKTKLPSWAQKQPNYAYASVEISGMNKKELFAHSAIQDESTISSIGTGITYKPQSSPFNYYNVDGNNIINTANWARDVDTEYKILTEVSNLLGSNYNATGKIVLYTEKIPCISCENVIAEFNETYPNIELVVVYGG